MHHTLPLASSTESSPRHLPRNAGIAAALLVAHLAALFAVPLATGEAAWRALALTLGFVAPSLTLWALAHECMHGHFAPTRPRLNRSVGRLLTVLHGGPYAVLRTGHLLHHKHNRQPCDASEVYDDTPTGHGMGRTAAPVRRPVLSYYLRLFGVLYLVQVGCSLLFLLPRAVLVRLGRHAAQDTNVIGALLKPVLMPGTLRQVRQDGLAIVALWSASAWCLGPQAWMLAVAVLARALLVSMHDNVYHYGTPLQGRRVAKTLPLPRRLSALILHFNYHDTHHRHPELPWYALPHRHDREGPTPELVEGWLRAWRRQLGGPLPRSQLAALAFPASGLSPSPVVPAVPGPSGTSPTSEAPGETGLAPMPGFRVESARAADRRPADPGGPPDAAAGTRPERRRA